MDERHNAESEIAQSRERIGVLAEELSRRATPEYVRERAMEKIHDVRDRAKDKVMVKTTELKGRAMESPKTFQLLGALAGWVLGSAFFKARSQRQHSYRLDSGMGYRTDRYNEPSWREGSYASEGAYSYQGDYEDNNASEGLREKVSDKVSGAKESLMGAKDNLKEKASEAMGAVRERAGHMRERTGGAWSSARERIPSAEEAKMRVSSAYHHTVEDRPLVAILGALFVGSLAAILIPVTSKERQVLSPAKDRLKEQIHKAGDAVEAKVNESNQQPSSSPEQNASSTGSEVGVGLSDSPLPSFH